MRKRIQSTAVLLLGLTVIGCAAPQEESATTSSAEPSVPENLTVYSGRVESLIGPLFERFEETSGIDLEVRYAGTAELVATLLEEGEQTPADVFVSQDAAALGALSARGRLHELPQELLDSVRPRHRSPAKDWVGLSGRARSVVYNPELVSVDELPESLEELTEPRYGDRFGVAPANASFQAHMAAYSVVNGRQELESLLVGLAANDPKRYPKNSAIVEAVLAGEIELGLVNHYYLHRALAERPEAPGKNFFMPADDGSAFVNLAGIGVLDPSPAAFDLIEFLLGTEAQSYFRDRTFEYPLAIGIGAGEEAMAALWGGQVDFAAVSERLEETLELIRTTGLLE